MEKVPEQRDVYIEFRQLLLADSNHYGSLRDRHSFFQEALKRLSRLRVTLLDVEVMYPLLLVCTEHCPSETNYSCDTCMLQDPQKKHVRGERCCLVKIRKIDNGQRTLPLDELLTRIKTFLEASEKMLLKIEGKRTWGG